MKILGNSLRKKVVNRMSRWMEAQEVSVDENELDILCGQDYDGNIYVTVKISDVLEAIAKEQKLKASQYGLTIK